MISEGIRKHNTKPMNPGIFKWLLARLFRFLFRIRLFQRFYFGLYKKCFRPWGLFNGLIVQSRIENGMVMTLDLGEWIQQNIYFFGIWDKPTHRFIFRHLHPDDVFVDVGANIGYFSLLASGIVGERGRVIALEPVGEVYKKLCEHLAVNHCSNVHSYQKAAYDKHTTLKIYLSSGENLGMSGIFRHDLESGVVEEVTAVTLDKLFADLSVDNISMIKIDIEGAELHALKGMEKTLKKHRPVLILEINGGLAGCSATSNRELLDFLEDLQYICKGMDPDGQVIDPLMTKGGANFAFFPAERLPDAFQLNKPLC